MTIVNLAGQVSATYEDGKITELTFYPPNVAVPVAEVWDGDESLDVTDLDGSFWKAVQAFLADKHGNPSITWRE